MSSPYGYGPTNMIRNFKSIHVICTWAGILGSIQSLIWMGLTITGIIAYNCIISYPEQYTFGSMIQSVFLLTYFRSESCKLPQWKVDTLRSVNTVLSPMDILIWDSVYLGVAVCWLLASVLLFLYIRKDNAKLTAGIMLNWAFFTLAICLMDLALGIIFGIDYGAFKSAADSENLYPANGNVTTEPIVFIGGQVSAISLMFVSFKGFVIWIINFGLMICVATHAVRALKDKDGNDTLFMPRKESDDILTTRPPIKAYEEETTSTVYNNISLVPYSQTQETIELNEEAIERAARISTDVALKDRRFRNLDAFQQYPPRYSGNNNKNITNYNNNNNNNNNNVNSNMYVSNPRTPTRTTREDDNGLAATAPPSGHPVPDYSPPMVRANQNSTQNGVLLRNQRY